jgi:hypothetical protein
MWMLKEFGPRGASPRQAISVPQHPRERDISEQLALLG